MGNACCRARSAAVASAPARERQPPEPPGVPDWTEVVPLFREGGRGHPTVKERYVLEELLGVGDDTYKGQRKATLRGAADVDGHPWPLVSGGARGLVLAMLEPDPSRRPTALQLLEHPWLKAAAIASEAPAPRGLI
ncbi:calcium-dependent protein kinase 2-like [Panicum miliaceum]|uniref:Calcium-dependent protein kinase 2-like n=1 Tax=Panicum miliaceum TaxID=4540 RepID=A0A3L6S6S1_PANMI|nr:calcium-dependent protein kinase 2-like [Panicum miliaceum]